LGFSSLTGVVFFVFLEGFLFFFAGSELSVVASEAAVALFYKLMLVIAEKNLEKSDPY
jgi:hypothetical protein